MPQPRHHKFQENGVTTSFASDAKPAELDHGVCKGHKDLKETKVNKAFKVTREIKAIKEIKEIVVLLEHREQKETKVTKVTKEILVRLVLNAHLE